MTVPPPDAEWIWWEGSTHYPQGVYYAWKDGVAYSYDPAKNTHQVQPYSAGTWRELCRLSTCHRSGPPATWVEEGL